MKNHIKINKYKLLNNPTLDDFNNAIQEYNFSLNDLRNAVLKSSESPYFKMASSSILSPSKPLSIEEIKDRFGGNEKYHRLYLEMFCDKIEPKWHGRPLKLIPNNTALNCKTLYQPSPEKIQQLEKEMIVLINLFGKITETQFRRRCRMLEKRWWDELFCLYVHEIIHGNPITPEAFLTDKLISLFSIAPSRPSR